MAEQQRSGGDILNKFTKGVNTDLAEDVVTPEELSGAHNIRLTTTDDKVGVVQKVASYIEIVDGYREDLIPLAVKDFADVIYFVSYNTTEKKVELGTYPTIDIEALGFSKLEDAKTYVIPFPEVEVTSTTLAPTRATVSVASDPVASYSVNFNAAMDQYVYGEAEDSNFTVSGGNSKDLFLVPYREEAPPDGVNWYIFTNQISEASLGTWSIPESSVYSTYTYTHNPTGATFLYVSHAEMGSGSFDETYVGQRSGHMWTRTDDGNDITFSLKVVKHDGTTALHQETFTYADGPENTYTISGSGYDGAFRMQKYVDPSDYSKVYYLATVSSLSGTAVGREEFVGFQFIYGDGSFPSPPSYWAYRTSSNNLVLPKQVPSSTEFKESKNLMAVLPPNSIIDDINMTRVYIELYSPLPLDAYIYLSEPGFELDYTPGDNYIIVLPSGASEYPASGLHLYIESAGNYTPTVSFDQYEITGSGNSTAILKEYGPLPNYWDPVSGEYINPFLTDAFGYNEYTEVDLEVQPSYDGSVNMIMVAEYTRPRIVNSRLKFYDNAVTLIERMGDNLDNVYSDDDIGKTLLMPDLGVVVEEGTTGKMILEIPELEFDGVSDGGNLENGGYKYFFKLQTSDGYETNIIEESRLVSVHPGSMYGKAYTKLDTSTVNKKVSFTLKNINDTVYKYVSVYFMRQAGYNELISKTYFKIDKRYEIINGECSITHTGYEETYTVTLDQLIAQMTPIQSVKTLSQKNNRLLLANVKSTKLVDDELAMAALYCYVDGTMRYRADSQTGSIKAGNTLGKSYADPTFSYNYTSYFPGETYEIGMHFMFQDGSTTPAYPIMGADYVYNGINKDLLGTDIGWVNNTGQNSYGVVRLPRYPDLDYSGVVDFDNGSVKIYMPSVNTSELHNNNYDLVERLIEKGVVGYFFSRKERIPDLLMEGLVTSVATAPISSYTNIRNSIVQVGYHTIGCGNEGSLDGKVVNFPVPANAMPFSGEAVLGALEDGAEEGDPQIPTAGGDHFDGIYFAPLPDEPTNKVAFFSPDITSDTTTSSHLVTVDRLTLLTEKKLIYDSTSVKSKDYDTITSTSGCDPKLIYAIGPSGYAGYEYEDGTQLTSIFDQIDTYSFVDDGYRSFSAGGFTGKLDRQLFYLLYTSLRSSDKWGTELGTDDDGLLIDYSNQLLFMTALVNDLLAESGIYASGSNFKWDGDYVTDVDETRFSDAEYYYALTQGVKYSPYLGLNLLIGNAKTLATNFDPNFTHFTAFTTSNDANRPTSGVIGGYAKIYNNNTSPPGPISTSYWVERYKAATGSGYYFSITPRIPISIPLDYGSGVSYERSILHGGDCFTGFYTQRVWRPAGIDGIPTASNPLAYAYDADTPIRQGVNITSSGLAVQFPVRSKYNFAIRALMDEDSFAADEQTDLKVEDNLYNKGRTYTSNNPSESDVLGNKQAETSMINYGNFVDDSPNKLTIVDENIPYAKIDYPNRVIVSEVSVKGEFNNGYRNFKGLNFKDFDEEYGPITKIISGNVMTYLVYEKGVAAIEIDERTAISGEGQSNVYIDSAHVLPPKSNLIFTATGSQDMKSVAISESAVYGFDKALGKAWKISASEPGIISDYRFNKGFERILDRELGKYNIITVYNPKSHLVTFSFIDRFNMTNPIGANYDETNNMWLGTTDVVPYHTGVIADDSLALLNVNHKYYLTAITEESRRHLLPPPVSAFSYTKIGDVIMPHDSYIEYVIKADTLEKFILHVMVFNGDGSPSKIELMPESSTSFDMLPASVDVTRKHSSYLPLYTPGYRAYAAPVTIEDKYTIVLNVVSPNVKILEIGDYFELTTGGELEQYRAANVVWATAEDLHITPDRELISEDGGGTLYYGWRQKLRTAYGPIRAGKTFINIPTKRTAELMSGIRMPDHNQVYTAKDDNTKPYGRWIRVRVWFNGIDPIYISSAESKIGIYY